MTGIAMVGCGYVADFYINTLVNHPQLQLTGVFDRDPERAKQFCSFHQLDRYDGIADVLQDDNVDIIVNLTNPDSHYEVSKASLEAGKHVYSEKPLAMEMEPARELVALAESRGLYLASAPCNLLGEAAQTIWAALREGAIGNVLLAYAEMDDGLVHRRNYREWVSASGRHWPWKDEFETGCTIEHAGYYLTWLAAFFGGATSVTSFASCQIPDKQTDVPLTGDTPDFSVACVQFRDGPVARLTCSIIAPHDRSLTIIGDEGILSVKENWDYGSRVTIQRRTPLMHRLEKYPLLLSIPGVGRRTYPLVRKPNFEYRGKGADRMDYCRGIAELAEAAASGRACRLSARNSLHVNEITLAIQRPDGGTAVHEVKSPFDPVEPMPWAVGPSR